MSLPAVNSKNKALLLLLLYCAIAVVVAHPPVGIHLGKKYLTSAVYTWDDELIPIVRIQANEAWQLYQSRISGYTRFPEYSTTYLDQDYDCHCSCSLNRHKVESMYRSTLDQIRTATAVALNQTTTVEIGALVLPEHDLHQAYGYKSVWQRAVRDGFLHFYHQILDPLDAARLGYDFDSCDYSYDMPLVGLNKCGLGSNYVLVVTYDSDRLSLGMREVGFHIYYPLRHFNTYKEYGEEHGNILDKNKSTMFSEDVKTFLNRTFEMEQVWFDINLKRTVSKPIDHFQAIILHGEASDTAMEEMRQALLQALPEHEDKFRTSLDPHYVGAFGAARRARRTAPTTQYMEWVQTARYVDWLEEQERSSDVKSLPAGYEEL